MEEDFAPVATGHIEAAFDLGMDVVTANKGPIAWNWRRVAAKAAATGRRVRFESTVMDGLPVFSLLESALPDCELLGFDAVFNSTTNFIMDAMARGESFESALGHAQKEGFAEADPATISTAGTRPARRPPWPTSRWTPASRRRTSTSSACGTSRPNGSRRRGRPASGCGS